jgi:hypothetical protein
VVRILAFIDLPAACVVAIPFAAASLVDSIFWLDQRLGLGTTPAALVPTSALAVNLAGVIGVVWALARLHVQNPPLARLDAWGRVAVAGVIVYYVIFRAQTPVLLTVVAAEGAAAVWESVATRRFLRATGG